ncbi:MAG: hypothetical protein QOD39_600 [Mycobacterium sp.]|jgi:hypothetical protein|nr:hypothetical protein [Mycobacterium sp.]
MTGSHRAIQETNKARVAVAGALGSVLIGAVATMTSPITANAAPETPSGAYQSTEHFPGEADRSGTWHFSPCGPTCTVLTNADGAGSAYYHNWKFTLNNGSWTYSGQQQSPCFQGGTAPIAIEASFDANTLAGQQQKTYLGDCGTGPLPSSNTTFELTKIS